MFPYQLHLLQSIQETGKLGTLHRDKSYVIAFVNPNDAILTARKIGATCKVDMGQYKPVRTVVTEHMNKGVVEMSFDDSYPVKIQKEITPNWEWIIETCDTMELLRLPISNTGVIIANKLSNETEKHLVFQGYIVDPLNDPNLFRVGLQNIDI